MAGPAGVAEPAAGVVAAAWLATRCLVAIARADWVWWRKVRRPAWMRAVIALCVVVPVLVSGLLFAADLYDGVRGCGSVDPTDPANYTTGQLVNDTSSPVTVDDCLDPFCSDGREATRLAPGRSID